jgi:hypothetical protein
MGKTTLLDYAIRSAADMNVSALALAVLDIANGLYADALASARRWALPLAGNFATCNCPNPNPRHTAASPVRATRAGSRADDAPWAAASGPGRHVRAGLGAMPLR